MKKEENKTRVACRDDWKTQPMPEQHETFVLHRSFSDAEMEVLRCGNIPQAMEDKWFWYMEGATLWAHRSWTSTQSRNPAASVFCRHLAGAK